MRGDAVAGAEVLHRTDGMAVLGQETIAHAIDALGVAGGKPLLQKLDTMTADEYLPFRCALEPCEQFCDAVLLFLRAMDEPFGDGGRRLERLMSHEVEDRYVACVSDAGEDRELELRTDRAEGVVIEAGEVVGCTAASYDDDTVERNKPTPSPSLKGGVYFVGDLFEGGEDGFGG
jgi:hypothetical protein